MVITAEIPKTALSNDQARYLLEAPPEDTLKAKRDRAILATLLYYGLRRQELCNLHVKDFQRRTGVMMFHVDGKRKKERFVPVEPKTQRLLPSIWKLLAIVNS
ncbi:MAG: site-specific integrase [Methylococcales bacterium]|nr:site-specific integrase [Methylococcales bacterium]